MTIEVSVRCAQTAVLFDLDGTLADSLPDIRTYLNEVLRPHGFAPFDRRAVETFIGSGARDLIARAVATRALETGEQFDIDALLAEFVQRYNANPCVETQLYSGVRELLDALRGAGVALAVVTNKPHQITGEVLAALGIADAFGAVIGASPERPLKPAPDMIFASLEQIGGIAPQNAVMVGDSINDVAAGKAAGTATIVMSHGYTDRPADMLGADSVLDDFAAFWPAYRSLLATP